jgi:hypothetical protein
MTSIHDLNEKCKYCNDTQKIYKVCGRKKCWENMKKCDVTGVCVMECGCKSNKKLWVCEDCFLRPTCDSCGHKYEYTDVEGVFWRECFCI